MRALIAVSMAVLALAACKPAETGRAPNDAAPPAVDQAPRTPLSGDTLTEDGFGPLRIGMERAEIAAAMGAPEAQVPPADCEVFHPARAPEGMTLLLENGRLARISLRDGATVKTAENLGVGSSAEQVKATYPGATVEPHKYVEGAQYVTAWKGGPPQVAYVQDASARGIRFELDGSGRVTAVHAGGPAIQLVESCG